MPCLKLIKHMAQLSPLRCIVPLSIDKHFPIRHQCRHQALHCRFLRLLWARTEWFYAGWEAKDVNCEGLLSGAAKKRLSAVETVACLGQLCRCLSVKAYHGGGTWQRNPPVLNYSRPKAASSIIQFGFKGILLVYYLYVSSPGYYHLGVSAEHTSL